MRQNSRETLKASLCCFFEAAKEFYSLLCAHLWCRRYNKPTMFESGPQHHQSQLLCYKLLKRRKHSSHVWRFCASAVFSPGITTQIRNAPWPAQRASGICWQPRYKGRRMLSSIFGKMAEKYGSIVPFCFSAWYNAGNAGNEPPHLSLQGGASCGFSRI